MTTNRRSWPAGAGLLTISGLLVRVGSRYFPADAQDSLHRKDRPNAGAMTGEGNRHTAPMTRVQPGQPEHRRPAFGRDVAVLTVIRLASVGAGFLTNVIGARVLGGSAMGAAGVAMTVATISALVANGGLNIASIYFLGRRPTDRADIVRYAFTLGLCAAALAIVLVGVATPVLAEKFPGLPAELLVAAAALAAAIIGFELTGSLVLGLDRRDAYLRVQSIEGIGSLAATAAIVLLVSATAAGYVAAAAIAYLAAAAYATMAVRRTVGPRLLGFSAAFARDALALGLRGQAGNVLQYLNLRLDLLLIPLFVDLRAAGVYLVAVRMSEVVTQMASAGAAFLFPAVARDEQGSAELTLRTTRLTLAVVVVVGTLIAIGADVFLNTFFGREFGAGASALRISMIAMVPLSITRLLASDLKGRGRPGIVSIGAAVALTATVAFNLLLIPAMGIEGAATASLLAYALGAVVLMAAFRRLAGASPWGLFPRAADFGQLRDVGIAWIWGRIGSDRI